MSLLSGNECLVADHGACGPTTAAGQLLSAQEREFERWRIAADLVRRLRDAGIDCELCEVRQMRS